MIPAGDKPGDRLRNTLIGGKSGAAAGGLAKLILNSNRVSRLLEIEAKSPTWIQFNGEVIPVLDTKYYNPILMDKLRRGMRGIL